MSNADFAKSVTPGLILPLAIVAICYLKCRVATNIINWLKVKSRWFKNYIFAKKCIFTCFWIFKYCFYYSFTLYYCTSFYSSGFFQYQLDVRQFRSRSGPTFGSKIFAKVISRQQKLPQAAKSLKIQNNLLILLSG